MSTRQLYSFRISYRLNGCLQLQHVEGINLRHAKDKILFCHPDATDLIDWTFEQDDDLLHFLQRNNVAPCNCTAIMGHSDPAKTQPPIAANH